METYKDRLTALAAEYRGSEVRVQILKPTILRVKRRHDDGSEDRAPEGVVPGDVVGCPIDREPEGRQSARVLASMELDGIFQRVPISGEGSVDLTDPPEDDPFHGVKTSKELSDERDAVFREDHPEHIHGITNRDIAGMVASAIQAALGGGGAPAAAVSQALSDAIKTDLPKVVEAAVEKKVGELQRPGSEGAKPPKK